MKFVPSKDMDKALVSLTEEIGTPDWLWGIEFNHDDAGVFIEVTVNDKYVECLSRKYMGVPVIISKRLIPVVKVKN